MKTSINKNAEIKKVTWIGLITNVFLSVIKFVAGLTGNSQAVLADAVHSLSDTTTDLAIIIGVKYWEPPADTTHPYGHKKIETIITLFIGLLLGFVAIEIFFEAINSISEPNHQKALWIAAIGPLISVIMKEMLYQWTVRTGRKSGSSAVIANAWHHRSDAMSSIPALIAVIIAAIFPEFSFIDSVGALIITLFILKVSWEIIKPAFMELTEWGACTQKREKIKQIVMNVSGVQEVHRIRGRQSGGAYLIDLHVLVNGSLSVRKGHRISEIVKEEIVTSMPEVIDVVVHLEPFEADNQLQDKFTTI